MQYITIVADSYEEAAEKARQQYGDAIQDVHGDFQVLPAIKA